MRAYGFRVEGSGLRVYGPGVAAYMAWGEMVSRFRVSGLGLERSKVQVSRFRGSGTSSVGPERI